MCLFILGVHQVNWAWNGQAGGPLFPRHEGQRDMWDSIPGWQPLKKSA